MRTIISRLTSQWIMTQMIYLNPAAEVQINFAPVKDICLTMRPCYASGTSCVIEMEVAVAPLRTVFP